MTSTPDRRLFEATLIVLGTCSSSVFADLLRPQMAFACKVERARGPNQGPDTEKMSLGSVRILQQDRGVGWSGTPGSNRRPSPWQDPDEDLHRDASRVNPVESLAPPGSVGEPVMSADATKCSPSTDAGLTACPALPGSIVAEIPDNRLFTVAEIAALLKVRRSAVYSACDSGKLRYVKFEGAVQIEGRDLKAWLETCHRTSAT